QALAQQELIDALLKAGVTIGDLETAAKDLGLELRNPETGKIEFAALQQVLQALKGLDFAKVGEDFASQLQHLEDLIQIGVVDPSEKFGKILELLGKTPSSSPAITGALAGLDVTTAGGRQAATGALQDLIEHIGDLTATEFGKLTRDQFTDVVKQLLELLRSDQPIAGNTLGLQPLIPGLPTGVSPELGAALGGLSGAGFGSGGLGDAFGVAAGTPDFSEFVQVEIGSQDLLRSIDSTLSRGIAPVSLVVNAPMTITVERGSGDAAQIGQAVQEAAAGLADQLVRQIEQALGDNLVTVNAQRGIATRRAV
ncbi:MAG TPA: hypothetical protein VGQ24_09795, partial [Gemmatimonadales bacterium]|nr:hypothetical protein [Gemmatimonadales bacterium]